MKVIDFFRTASEEQLAKFLDNAIDDREVFHFFVKVVKKKTAVA